MRTSDHEVTFLVDGLPAPKGSPRVYIRGKNGVPLRAPKVRADSDATEAWAEAVSWAAKLAMRGRKPFVDVPLRLEVVFFFTRPKDHFSRASGLVLPSAPASPRWKPDGDKVQRTTQDAMQGFVFDEDSRFVEWHGRKMYGRRPGAWINVREAPAALITPLGALQHFGFG